jgi:CMP-N,N'-diacetyllegionaminic acid synthase
MKIDAIILARGGSKAIPKKNVIDFCGKPLMAWTIEQCFQAHSINNVWVSSDDDFILDTANKLGANLIKRPNDISDDYATSESGWLHAIEYVEKQSLILDAVFAPQVTSPLRKPDDIDNAVNLFFKQKLHSLFSASIVDDLYYWEINDGGKLNSINYNYKDRKRRQEFKMQIIENGSFYIFTPELIRKKNNRLGGEIGFYKMKPWQIFEIDDFENLEICSALMNKFVIKG